MLNKTTINYLWNFDKKIFFRVYMSETYLVGPLSSFEFEATIGLVHATSLALTISYEYLFLILYYWMELI